MDAVWSGKKLCSVTWGMQVSDIILFSHLQIWKTASTKKATAKIYAQVYLEVELGDTAIEGVWIQIF